MKLGDFCVICRISRRIFFCLFVLKEGEVVQSCPTLYDPMGYSLLTSSIHGIFQARVLEWVAISFCLKGCFFFFFIMGSSILLFHACGTGRGTLLPLLMTYPYMWVTIGSILSNPHEIWCYLNHYWRSPGRLLLNGYILPHVLLSL